jgi:putative tricarboxylic transport membrane protein
MDTPDNRVTDVRGIGACALVMLLAGGVFKAAADFEMLGAVFPRAVASLLMVLAGLYIVLALKRPSPPPERIEGSRGRRIAMFGVMLAWALLLEPLGFLTTSLACYAAALLIANYDRWTPRMAMNYAGVGLTILVGLYLLFSQVLAVPLPSGVMI